MPVRAKWAWIIALGLLLGAFVVRNGLAYWHAPAMLIFQPSGERTAAPERLPPLAKLRVLLFGVDVPRPGSGRSPGSLDPSRRALSIDSAQRVAVAAWY